MGSSRVGGWQNSSTDFNQQQEQQQQASSNFPDDPQRKPHEQTNVCSMYSFLHQCKKQNLIKESSIGLLIYKNSLPFTEDREQGESYSNPLKKPQLSVYVSICGSVDGSWKGGGMPDS
jgi:hypothetical protein